MPTVLEPAPINKEQRQAQKIVELEKRISDLERTQRVFPQVSGAPTNAAADGSGAADTAGPYLWVRVNGVWRRTPALT